MGPGRSLGTGDGARVDTALLDGALHSLAAGRQLPCPPKAPPGHTQGPRWHSPSFGSQGTVTVWGGTLLLHPMSPPTLRVPVGCWIPLGLPRGGDMPEPGNTRAGQGRPPTVRAPLCVQRPHCWQTLPPGLRDPCPRVQHPPGNVRATTPTSWALHPSRALGSRGEGPALQEFTVVD